MSWMLMAAAAVAVLAAGGLWFVRRRAAQQWNELQPEPLPGLPQPVAVERRFRGVGAPATGWPSTLTGMPHDER